MCGEEDMIETQVQGKTGDGDIAQSLLGLWA